MVSTTSNSRVKAGYPNLLAVSLHQNREKGDEDASGYLPPLRSFDCSYVARQIAVKAKYHLSVSTGEKAAMQRVLRRLIGAMARGQEPPRRGARNRIDRDQLTLRRFA